MKTKISMYKISGGSKIYNFELFAISEEHAHVVVRDFYERMGLIGRFYYETSTGGCYSIK